MPESPLTSPASDGTLIKKENATLNAEPAPARKIRVPRPAPHDPGVSSVGKKDILFALFKHQRQIILGLIAGLLGAAAVYFFYPPIYESQAKLLVRYMVERSSVDPIDSSSTAVNRTGQENVLGSELEILNSWDLAVQVADSVGPKRLLPNSKSPSKESAAAAVASGLKVGIHVGSNIIFVSYTNKDPEVATLVLNELVNRYFNKHLEVHRSAGAFDFVTQQTDQVRARLNQTEDALRDLKGKAGIVSLENSTTSLNSEAERLEEQLHFAEADLAEQQARVREINASVGGVTIIPTDDRAATSSEKGNAGTKSGKSSAGKNATAESTESEKADSPPPPKADIPSSVLQRYQVLVSGLQKLRQTQLDLFGKYTPESQMVRSNQIEIDDVDHQIRSLEKTYPDLPSRAGPISSSSNGNDLNPAAEAARVAGLRAKKNSLAARLQDVRKRIDDLAQLSPQIADLERQKQLEETNYKYFEATLEKARVDEALDPSKIPNISAVQRPSPPLLVTKTRNKIMLGLAGGGLALAIAFALFKELMFTESLRSSTQVERFVGVTPLMSIPNMSRLQSRSVSKANGRTNGQLPKGSAPREIAPWDSNHFIRRYTEAIRDRLGLYFELHDLTHKPKLVGVAGLSDGSGTSTLAAGLAAALSETNDGKVLVVDANLGPDQVHPFFKGKPAYPINAALKTADHIDPAAENLYLATVGTPNAGPAQLGLKKFFDLMPNLKASDFDYIIFDLPPLEQTSPTWGMAPFMDKLLVIVEAGKDTRRAAKHCYRRLVSERDNVSVILNKTRSYGPKALDLEG